MKIRTITGLIAFTALMIFSTIFDYQISVYCTELHLDWYVWFGARFGAATSPYMLALCISGLSILEKRKTQKIILSIANFIACLVAAYLIVRPTLTNIYLILIFLILSICGYYVINKLSIYFTSNQNDKNIYKNGIALVLVSTAIVNILKCIWGRPRFYSLVEMERSFVPWYTLHPFVLMDDSLKSFPSGHTASASSILLLLRLFKKINLSKVMRVILHVMVYAWIVITASSRIFGGFHYLSDTLMAFGVTWLCYYFLMNKQKSLKVE